MTRIAIVEDEADIASVVQDYLRHAGYETTHFTDGRSALEAIVAAPPDLTLLDVMLPRMDGIEVLRRAREHTAHPIIMLTARIEEVDRLLGLELGADDYVCKPFSPRELVARVRARLRRSTAPVEQAGWQQHGRFAIDRDGSRIRFADQPLELTRYEYALMAALLQRPGAILSRAQLMDRGWDTDADSADRTVDTHVKTLRAKLRAAGADPDPIRTHRGLGYALEV